MNIENVIELPAGEFDLEMTQKSGQTSQPPWHEVGGEFRELLMVRGRPCPVAVRQRGRVLEVRPYLRVNRNDLKKRIEYIFDLKFDLEDFYSFLDDMGLSESIESSRGLRLFLAKDPFECIISSIASQNCSVLRWTRSIMDIRRMWGPAFRVSSETFHVSHPQKSLQPLRRTPLRNFRGPRMISQRTSPSTTSGPVALATGHPTSGKHQGSLPRRLM